MIKAWRYAVRSILTQPDRTEVKGMSFHYESILITVCLVAWMFNVPEALFNEAVSWVLNRQADWEYFLPGDPDRFRALFGDFFPGWRVRINGA